MLYVPMCLCQPADSISLTFCPILPGCKVFLLELQWPTHCLDGKA